MLCEFMLLFSSLSFRTTRSHQSHPAIPITESTSLLPFTWPWNRQRPLLDEKPREQQHQPLLQLDVDADGDIRYRRDTST